MSKTIVYMTEEEDKGLPVRELLSRRLKLSSRLIRNIKYRGGSIFLNGESVKTNMKISKPGEEIKVVFPAERSNFMPQDIKFDVLYEDEDLLAVNKPAGYVVHPTKGHPKNTIANGVMQYMKDRGESYKIRFINRLDMDTTGVLLIGKNPQAQDGFTAQADRGNVTKRYLAVANGLIDSELGVIDLPIGQVDPDKVSRSVTENGTAAVTHYKVLKRSEQRKLTLLELELETGKTHQIRVHLAHIGHPVVGDALYGKSQPALIERQALHASELIFRHPFTGARLDIKAPLPKDMSELADSL